MPAPVNSSTHCAQGTAGQGRTARARSRRRWHVVVAIAAIVAGVALVGGCDDAAVDGAPAQVVDPSAFPSAAPVSTSVVAPQSVAPPATTVATRAASPDASAAVAQLDTLAVKGRAPKTGYDRDLFGQAWTDDVNVEGGHNGCDTRNDILRRDLTAIVYKTGSNECAVRTGTLADPYTGTTIAFTRGQSTSSAVQIDHVVALSDAWQKGAQQLTPAQRADFANDPRNLQATDGPINQQKSDGDAATWLPPNKAYRCTYVARQVAVKAAYTLWVTQAEKDAIARTLTACGAAAPAPTTPAADTAQTPTTTAPPIAATTTPALPPTYSPPPQPAYTPPAAVGSDSSVYYPNCAAVRAAGADPILAGDPGYSSKLDRDGDGIACE
ncbi:MAG: deoxyribonuclease [Gordonia sp.]|nr:deoxyribonuclease [Gordonia sp. (in: high G+C Gram-positive bacteria)]